MKTPTRIERDSMGEVLVPAEAIYGAETQRAVENFPISRLRFTRPFIRALGLIKAAAARANGQLGALPRDLAAAIEAAAQRVAKGEYDAEFVVDIFQTGSGTSTNMNANEVIARIASAHPHDHVNLSQSSNDVIPTATTFGCGRPRPSRTAPRDDATAYNTSHKSRGVSRSPEDRTYPFAGCPADSLGPRIRWLRATNRTLDRSSMEGA